jgi:hypothetical protein
MSLKKCKDCGKEISKKAKACPNCGKPNNRTNPFALGCLVFVVLFMVFFVITSTSKKNKPTSYSRSSSDNVNQTLSSSELKDKLKTLFDTGLLIKFDVDLNEAYVNPIIWNATDVKTKKGMGIVLAEICHNKGSTGRITFYNNNSGDKLAKYSRNYGYKKY